MNGVRVGLLEEPNLAFRYGQLATDPHVGLGLYGPCDTRAGASGRCAVCGCRSEPDHLGF
jgi:hypothetical protein